MRLALALVAGIMVVWAGLAATSPSPAALLSDAPATLFLTLLAQATARGVSRFGLGYPSQRGGIHPPAYRRLVVVALGALGGSSLIASGTTEESGWLAEVAHGLVLAGAGVALARWSRSSERSPVFLAIGLVVLSSARAALTRGMDMTAVQDTARVLMRLPLDASVLWAAWHVAAVRGRVD